MRRAAARSQCANNLKQNGIGVHGYHDVYGHFPAGTVPDAYLLPEERMSFLVSLLPFVEKKDVHDKLNPAQPWDSEVNRAAVGGNHSWHLFQCSDWTRERWHSGGGQNPSTGHDAFTNYVGMAGVGTDAATRPIGAPGIGMFGFDRTLKAEQVKDGLANTMMLIETGFEVAPWMRGGPGTVRAIDPAAGQLTGDGLPFGGTHFLDSTVIRKQKPDGFHVLLADGSVRYTRNSVHPDVLVALATVAGGDTVSADW